jgi:hypothetical protein
VNTHLALAAGAALALTACSSVHVRTDFDPDTDFSRLTTYAWMARPGNAQDVLADDSLIRNRVMDAVDAELAAKGLRRDASSPSFLVSAHAGTRERMRVIHSPSSPWPWWGYGWRRSSFGGWGAGVGWGTGWGYDTDVMQYTEGSLVLDFVDPARAELLWRGVATSVMDDEWGSEERIREAVRELLARYPPSEE